MVLGDLAEGSNGFEPDQETAAKCYRAASMAGYPGAAEKLVRVEATVTALEPKAEPGQPGSNYHGNTSSALQAATAAELSLQRLTI
jgi:hypothetical protein